MPQIHVHEKALAHLSRGLYRSPASALRELVSNAWDANATHVLIGTNYPNFAQIAVQDNGDGFTKQDFERLMEGGIGNSDKRQMHERLIHDRPLIGRLGIGLLGIAQICGSFEVSSKPKTGEAFRARVQLYDLIREKLDSDDPSVVKELGADAAPLTNEDERAINVREVDVGEYEFVELEEDELTRGTQITSDDVHPTFVRSFRESLSAPKFEEPALEWGKCLDVISRLRTLHEVGDYWKLIWELSATCPTAYISSDAVPRGAIKEIQQRLLSYDFTLRVDGITLAKPVRLHGNEAGYTVERIHPTSINVYGKNLRFEGYIAVQEGRQIQPDELRGIMLRIKNVGVGYYDPSFLDYAVNQGPRAKWVTGEIFVHSGLEDALNVDRDSFNRFHPEFRAVQKYLHGVLQDKVFPAVYKKLIQRSASRVAEREEIRASGLEEAISASLDAKVKVKLAPAGHDPVTIERTGDQFQITFGDLSQLRTKKAQRRLAASILALYDIASRERGSEQQRSRFEELLLGLLSRW